MRVYKQCIPRTHSYVKYDNKIPWRYIMSKIARRDIILIEGEDFIQTFRVRGDDDNYINFEGFSAVGEVRTDYTDESELLASFTFSFDEESLTAKIDYQETFNWVNKENESTRTIPVGFYDIFLITPDGDRRYFIGGSVNYAQTITR